ncbi:MAG: N-acetyltransferase [Alphaproteobacteria bacterium]|nr:MAG: N-acetyltransferase [Alphaproteobacteria bacterium]
MNRPPAAPQVVRLDSGFAGWAGVLALILDSFAYMEGRIDPPSSALRMTIDDLRARAASGTVLAVLDGDRPVACLFCEPRGAALYLGKLAVDPSRQGEGLGRLMVLHAEELARRERLGWLELQVRIELTRNQAFFAALGFEKTAEGAHAGYDRPTWLEMRKRLADAPAGA